ncbi:stage II sporulation protein D [Bacillus taeanensis]|uniref:Stage II sporulation protein D n=1 Tax=Bacillus taeanensis TaxID=273032 RepID=A0A366XX76_9BACI|nr:stage II sporulation protein D [Bacillus taeanensis]RBW68744.1 stage II sporulation protein D [Bacillus taeanensis]
MKRFFVVITILTSIVIIIPALLVLPFSETKSIEANVMPQSDTKASSPAASDPAVEVAVYRTQTKTVENLSLEDYVIGVVASEMPAEFEMEALKAQSLTARTYIVKQLLQPSDMKVPSGAVVTDSTLHQVFRSKEELKQLWGADYEWKIERITKAVKETGGQILTYDGNPIEASFFSTSNGYTENSEDYWQNEIPYLKSVKSPWDVDSPKFYDQKSFSASEFQRKLNVTLPDDGTIGKIVNYTEGKRVAEVTINGKTLEGREVREKLDLKSSDFTWERKGDQVVVTTKGYGHGVGMSQYGANGMAQEGQSFQDIVSYYYQGIEISPVQPFVTKMTAKK